MISAMAHGWCWISKSRHVGPDLLKRFKHDDRCPLAKRAPASGRFHHQVNGRAQASGVVVADVPDGSRRPAKLLRQVGGRAQAQCR